MAKTTTSKTKKAAASAKNFDAPKNFAARSISFGGEMYKFNDITKVHPALKSFFCYGINKVAGRKKMKLEEALHPLGVLTIHVGVLKLVALADKINQNQICDEIGLDKATMVKIVDYLQNKKWVERQQSPEDRRANLITITAAGRKLLQRATKISEAVEKAFLERLSPEEIKTFKSILMRLLD